MTLKYVLLFQEIMHVKNKYTLEYTAYNMLRARRPYRKPEVQPLD